MIKREPRAPKRKFSDFTLKEVLKRIGTERITPWAIDAPPRPASAFLNQHLQRLRSFDLRVSEAAKTLLVDALYAEIAPDYPELKVWKGAALEGADVRGYADYLVTPDRDYLDTPLLCVVEAKRDEFDRGTPQCLMEMYVCRERNLQGGMNSTVYGVVTNGQGWQFYALGPDADVRETPLYSMIDLPRLLGALDQVMRACRDNWAADIERSNAYPAAPSPNLSA